MRPAPSYDLTATPVRGGANNPKGREADPKRIWTRSYVTLTNARGDNGTPNKLVNWLNVQSVPSELPPNFAGAATSEIMHMLETGHYGTKLTPEELEKFAAW